MEVQNKNTSRITNSLKRKESINTAVGLPPGKVKAAAKDTVAIDTAFIDIHWPLKQGKLAEDDQGEE
ncbi:hypothetical protein SUGI_0011500 [Cryptomeria japonica]|nr:hypothetical protein SUGI_0011500 [Cryptomeria japonica]